MPLPPFETCSSPSIRAAGEGGVHQGNEEGFKPDQRVDRRRHHEEGPRDALPPAFPAVKEMKAALSSIGV